MVHFFTRGVASVRRLVRRCESEISQKIDSSGAFEAIMHQTTPMNSLAIQRRETEKTKQWRQKWIFDRLSFRSPFFRFVSDSLRNKTFTFSGRFEKSRRDGQSSFFCTSSSRVIVGSKKESLSRARAQTRAKARRSLLTSFELVSKFIFGKFIGCLFFSWMIFFLCRNLVVRFLFIVFLIWMTIKHLS